MDGMKAEVTRLMSGSGREVNQAYLMGPDGWNEYQAGVLDGIPVTLIAGDRFTAPAAGANPTVWPNDGLVAATSALAVDVSDRCCRTGSASRSTTPTASTSPTRPDCPGRPA